MAVRHVLRHRHDKEVRALVLRRRVAPPFGDADLSLREHGAVADQRQPGRLALSDAMMRTIGAFAASGDPNNAALGAKWPTWPSTLVFDATPTAKAISVQ